MDRRLGAPPAERLAFLSALLPGMGQWFAGRRRRGLLLALPALAAMGLVIAVLVSVDVDEGRPVMLAKLLVQPRWLWVLVLVNGLLALERLVSIGDAWLYRWQRAEGSAATWAWRAGVLVVALALLVPHFIVHRYATDAIAMLETVFVQDPLPPLAEREEQSLAEDPEGDLGPVASTTTSTTPAAVTSSTVPVASTEPEAPAEVDNPLGERLTVLLAGGDFGPGRQDLRTDVMIVASIDLETGKAALISVYRDLVDVPLPSAWARAETMIQVQEWHEGRAYAEEVAEALAAGEEAPPRPEMEICDCYADRINYLYVHTHSWVRTFPDAPDPGMEALRQTLSQLLGIEIDYYVLVDFAGFVDLIDALGGVQVTVTESMHVAYSPAKEGEEPVRIDVEPGEHILDGHQALAYVRDRTTGAQERMRRQHCMVRDVATEIDMVTLFWRFSAISEVIRTSTTTNIPLDYLPDIIEAVGSLEADDIATFSIASPPYTKGLNYMGLPIVDAPAVRTGVADLLAGVSAGTTLGTVESDCG